MSMNNSGYIQFIILSSMNLSPEQIKAQRATKLALYLREQVNETNGNWVNVNIDVLLDAAEYLELFAALTF